MLVFRSEDHLAAWIASGNPRGETMTLEQQWELAKRWFEGRHLLGWKKRTASEAEAVLHSVGLDSPFWSM